MLLLHGWPYDIHSYAEVAPLLAARGLPGDRAVPARLRHDALPVRRRRVRNGQQAALARRRDRAAWTRSAIESAIVAGFDWGARTANIVAALWPERCTGAGVGERLPDRQPGGQPAAVAARRPSSRGGTSTTSPPSAAGPGYEQYRHEFAKLIWHIGVAELGLRRRDVRPQRGGVRQPRPRRHRDPQLPLAARPGRGRAAVRRPRAHGSPRRRPSPCPPSPSRATPTAHRTPSPSAYAAKFTGKYAHRTIAGGVGHNLPQEAPQAFVDAVLELGSR